MGENKFKVFIPAAGIGSRLGEKTKFLCKPLVPVGRKPSLSIVLSTYPADTDFVIALGYKGNLIREYVQVAHPQLKAVFVDVEPFEGEGSGLGWTMLCCKDKLQCPFVFHVCDTIVSQMTPPATENWMAGARTEVLAEYRSLKVLDGTVKEICEKGALDADLAYIGLCGIHDYKDFWSAMESGRGSGAIEQGESYGLRYLISNNNVVLKEYEWLDSGNVDALAEASAKLDPDYKSLDKPDEAIYFVDGHVIKFFADPSIVKGRVKRNQVLTPSTPPIIRYTDHFYCYEYVEGTVMSEIANTASFIRLLEWCSDHIWQEIDLDASDREKFQKSCMQFYKKKTFDRVEKFLKEANMLDSPEVINSVFTPKTLELLHDVNWNSVANGFPCRMHGDLHFENILLTKNHSFCLLDWRQDFGGICECGDIYYDLAKLYHGLIVSHPVVKSGGYKTQSKYIDEVQMINIDILRPLRLVECDAILENFVKSSGLDWHRVEVLTALIFLNIAPLHHHPYNLFLYYLGKRMLFLVLKEADVTDKLIQ